MELNDCQKSQSYSVILGNTDSPWYLKYKKTIFGVLAVLCICIIIAIVVVKVRCTDCDKTSSSNEFLSDSELLLWNVSLFQDISQCPPSFQNSPPLLLISLDGLRDQYLGRGLSPTLSKIAEFGVKADFMYPVYPARTFPNHYSIVTGLYPPYHGIIDNQMYDDDIGEFFKVGKTPINDTRWWQKEPLWVTARKQGKYTATYFWPGSDVMINGSYPDVYYIFNKSVPLETRVDQVIEWLSSSTPPDLITLYMETIDEAGHKASPDSQLHFEKNVNEAIRRVDSMMDRLLYGLQQRNLSNCVNILITSDHGMTKLDCNQLIDIRQYINITTVRALIGTFGRLKPRENMTTTDEVVSAFKCKNEHMRVYHKELLPIRMHYVENPRIEPIILDIDSGYYLTNYDPDNKWCNGGNHGYDYLFSDMRAIFLAHGPSFKKNITIRPFQNIELYELMSELIGIEPQPNNGTKGSLHEILINPSQLPPQEPAISPPVAEVPANPKYSEAPNENSRCACYIKLEQEADSAVIESHRKFLLPFGIPEVNGDNNNNNSLVLLQNDDYIVGYDVVLNVPRWTGFTITKIENTTEALVCWSPDVRVETAICSLTPNGIVNRPLYPPRFSSVSTQRQAFLVTNSVLKSAYHTSVLEKEINSVIKKRTAEFAPINVMMGPVLNPHIQPNEIEMNSTVVDELDLIPSHIFVVLTWCSYDVRNLSECDGRYLDVQAFILPNFPYTDNCEPGHAVLKKNVAQVIDVERITGLRFYSELDTSDVVRLRTSMSHLIL